MLGLLTRGTTLGGAGCFIYDCLSFINITGIKSIHPFCFFILLLNLQIDIFIILMIHLIYYYKYFLIIIFIITIIIVQ